MQALNHSESDSLAEALNARILKFAAVLYGMETLVRVNYLWQYFMKSRGQSMCNYLIICVRQADWSVVLKESFVSFFIEYSQYSCVLTF